MLKSITYLEIRCKYNKPSLKLFANALQNSNVPRTIIYRHRRYDLTYIHDEDEFKLFNKSGLLVASIVGEYFQYYVSSAPEIGLDFVWGLLAKMNVYPVTSL